MADGRGNHGLIAGLRIGDVAHEADLYDAAYLEWLRFGAENDLLEANPEASCKTGVTAAQMTLVKQIAAIPNIGAFKDASGNYGWHRDIVRELDGPDGEAAVMGSDGMGYHVWGHLYGSRCYLTGLGNVWPKIEVEFYDKLDAGDQEGALEIVNRYELDYLNATKATGRYWACLKYFLDELGLPGGPMRPPLLDCTDEDKKNLTAMAKRTGLM